MSNFIENPLKNQHWDPSQGDYINERILKEDRQYIMQKRRKKLFIIFMTFAHIFLLALIIIFFK
jgi:hypothetical protein